MKRVYIKPALVFAPSKLQAVTAVAPSSIVIDVVD